MVVETETAPAKALNLANACEGWLHVSGVPRILAAAPQAVGAIYESALRTSIRVGAANETLMAIETRVTS
jgi:hypothetical protein